MSDNIKSNILHIMSLRQMTSSELAERAGISKSYIHHALTSGRTIGTNAIEKFARGLGVPPNSLVTGIIPDFMDPVHREIEERELLREDPKAFRAMLRVVKNAKETK
jgi:transcriptional regulator with XRE-family HTH domain